MKTSVATLFSGTVNGVTGIITVTSAINYSGELYRLTALGGAFCCIAGGFCLGVAFVSYLNEKSLK